MPFLTDTDYKSLIDDDDLTIVESGDSSIREQMEVAAIEYFKGFTRSRYDMAHEFAQEGELRNPVLIMYVMDEVLYNLHASAQGRVVPEHRQIRKENLDEWLDKVQTGKVNPGFKVLDDEDGESDPGVPFKFGSNEKNSSDW